MRVRTTIAVLLCLALGSSALGQPFLKTSYDGTAVPDVDKPGVPNDMSCWMAAAANMLGAAGYGTGANAAAKAGSIYNTLRTDLGYTNMGSTEYAINYWLYTYGKNPDSSEFAASRRYTDVTVEDFSTLGRFLNATDYSFLQQELVNCQYIEVSFDNPAHAMTFVGFDTTTNQSIWHDSDIDMYGTDDDYYNNVYDQSGNWDLEDPQTAPTPNLDNADGYVLLCSGLNKPEHAVLNYDVAWYLTDNEQYTQGATPRDAVWTAEFREAGEKKDDFDDPFWLDSTHERYLSDRPVVHVDNEEIDSMEKEVYLLVDYRHRNQDPVVEAIKLQVAVPGDPANVSALLDPTSVQWNEHDGQALFTWLLDYQPAWEEIVFPDWAYNTLEGRVKDWDVATICTPEPATMSLLAFGAVALLRRRKRSALPRSPRTGTGGPARVARFPAPDQRSAGDHPVAARAGVALEPDPRLSAPDSELGTADRMGRPPPRPAVRRSRRPGCGYWRVDSAPPMRHNAGANETSHPATRPVATPDERRSACDPIASRAGSNAPPTAACSRPPG